MQQLAHAAVLEHGVLMEIIDQICEMTGFRTRYVVYTLTSGQRIIAKIGPS